MNRLFKSIFKNANADFREKWNYMLDKVLALQLRITGKHIRKIKPGIKVSISVCFIVILLGALWYE